MKRLLAIPLLLALGACTPSQTACSSMDSFKLAFDEFAAEGEFSQNTILYVNTAYDEAHAICIAPPGTYDQAMMIATATRVALTIRRAMRESDVAYPVLAPQLDKLEHLLKEARK